MVPLSSRPNHCRVLLSFIHCFIRTVLRFELCSIHEEYLLHLFDLFKDYCSEGYRSTGPRLYTSKPDNRTGKTLTSLRFERLSLPCFNELYQSFYLNGVKAVPA